MKKSPWKIVCTILTLSLLLGSLALIPVFAAGNVVELVTWDQAAPTDVVGLAIQKGFDDTHPNIHVTHKAMPTATEGDRAAFMTAMAGGTGPDCYGGAHFPTISAWANKGYCLPLDKYVAKWPDFKQFTAGALSTSKVNGHWYGLPTTVYTMELVYRKDLFKAAGLDPNKPPKTWAEFAKYAVKLTNPDKNQYGTIILGQEWASWWWEFYVWQAGGDVTGIKPDGTAYLRLTEKASVDALQFYKDLRWKYKCTQKNITQDFTADATDFATGKVAMTFCTGGWVSWWESLGLDTSKIGFAPPPVGSAGKPYIAVGGENWIINPTISKEKQDAAWQYISYMTSKKTFLKRAQMDLDNGVRFAGSMCPFKNTNVAKYYPNEPKDYIKAEASGAKYGKPEYALKELVDPILSAQLQIILTDEKADPATVLKNAQAKIQKEVIDPYNVNLKK